MPSTVILVLRICLGLPASDGAADPHEVFDNFQVVARWIKQVGYLCSGTITERSIHNATFAAVRTRNRHHDVLHTYQFVNNQWCVHVEEVAAVAYQTVGHYAGFACSCHFKQVADTLQEFIDTDERYSRRVVLQANEA